MALYLTTDITDESRVFYDERRWCEVFIVGYLLHLRT